MRDTGRNFGFSLNLFLFLVMKDEMIEILL
jgi:hypothetical protein